MSETLLERRRRLLRDEIGRVAIDLFATRGFDDVTVDDISEAVGTSQRTFFRYFPSKDAIVLDLARRLDGRLLEALRARPADEGALTALRNAYCETSHVEPGDREAVLKSAMVLAQTPVLRARAQGEYITVSEVVLASLAERMGTEPTDLRVRVLATSVSAVSTAEFYRWAEEGGEGDPSDRIAAALDVLSRGLRELDRPQPPT